MIPIDPKHRELARNETGESVRFVPFLTWGVRREDGEPWLPDSKGGWARGDETTLDGMVIVAVDMQEAVAMLFSQNVTGAADQDHNAVIQPGRVVPVRLDFVPAASRDALGAYGWVDVPEEELIRKVRNSVRALESMITAIEEAAP